MNLLTIKLFAALVLFVVSTAGYFSWHRHVDRQGYDRATREWQIKTQAADSKALAVLTEKNEQVRVAQAGLRETQQQIIEKSKELQDAKDQFNTLRAAYAIGTKRMSIATSSCQGRSADNAADPAIASDASEGRANLLPETALAILDIARGNSEDVRLKNECIDLYNAARDAVNR
jgi:hypothetical protein